MLVECHGALHKTQCLSVPNHGVWASAKATKGLKIDAEYRAAPETLPQCRAFRCRSIARPNVLLFHDTGFNQSGTERQLARFQAWMAGCEGTRLVILELGAGTEVRTIREMTRTAYLDTAAAVSRYGGAVDAVRINRLPDDRSETRRSGGLSLLAHLEMDAAAALEAVATVLERDEDAQQGRSRSRSDAEKPRRV